MLFLKRVKELMNHGVIDLVQCTEKQINRKTELEY